jgi:pyrroline-5-carboxylate reductase
MTQTTVFIGGGMMGEALFAGALAAGADPAEIVVVERSDQRAETLRERYGIAVTPDLAVVSGAAVVVVAVKPYDVVPLLREIGPQLAPSALIVSVAAGLTLEVLEAALPDGAAVVRVMPNTPALVGKGMAALSPGSACSPEQVARVRALMEATGKALVVPESQQDAVVAVSGSGPAYVFYVADAMIEAGVMLGLSRATSTELTVQTLLGAATMLSETGTHPVLLREAVTSPGGTTAEALRQLDAHGVRSAFLAAMEACRDKSRTLA